MIGKFFSIVPGGEGKNTAITPCLQVQTVQFLLFREESMWQHLCNTVHVPQPLATQLA
jgi:hypothetical protein